MPSDESLLARRAAEGDAAAIGELYGRYEKRAFNLAYRVTGSEDDAADATQDAFLSVLRQLPKLEGRELAFGSYLFTSVRNACYDLIQKRKRAEPSDVIPEGAAPVSSGGAFDPGDPDDDGDRKVLLEAQQEEIRQANATLPERQREALALRELEDMSYDEIAEIMDMNRNSVAQLISRARIGLRDALRGTALASVAVSSPDCERALPLIAASMDRQLEAGGDAAWLDQHLAACGTCRVARDSMEEAGVSYRAWVPVAVSPLLFRETMALAAEQTGADLDELLEGKRSRRPRRPRARDVVLAGLASLVLLLGVFAAATHEADVVTKAEPAAAAEEPQTADDRPAKKAKKKRKGAARKDGAAAAPATAESDEPDEPGDADEPEAGSGNQVAGDQQSGRRVARKRSGGSFGGGGGGNTGQDLDDQGRPAPPAITPDPAPTPPPTTPTNPPTRTAPETPNDPPTCRDPLTGRPVPCR